VAKIQSAFVGLTLLALLCGCVSTTVVKTNPIPAVKATREVPEPELLDVGISIFDPGLPKTDEEREKATKALVFPEVRQAESRYFPYVLKQTLEDTGHWGAVRVIPRPSNSVDLTVQGRIVSSDGERLVLAVNAVDATGRVWIKDKEYEDLAAKLSYRDSVGHGADPFQDIYIQIANDLTLMAGSIPGDELRRIREVAELRFAQDLAPTIFDGYLTQNEEGLTVPLRLPAPEDPNVDRMRRVREREYMFFDTLDGHYAGFHDDMNKPYDEWRKYSYDEVVALHEMEREARLHKVLGAATIAGGILVDHSSDWGAAAQAAGIYGGMMLLKTGLTCRRRRACTPRRCASSAIPSRPRSRRSSSTSRARASPSPERSTSSSRTGAACCARSTRPRRASHRPGAGARDDDRHRGRTRSDAAGRRHRRHADARTHGRRRRAGVRAAAARGVASRSAVIRGAARQRRLNF
jgi:hypothetical protein